ncbi:hypothetical protein JD844_021943 [Phrynosoma platyrhinos]|uniref:Uncharacterized protein n=1 Tax=Phrynosoma platyrhinos TaxID=52577 RepID=A0ABQ7SUQ1_PHRPL|nr:hypothetical protein JD844_021943 [Phrynosoma platyrhinos]
MWNKVRKRIEVLYNNKEVAPRFSNDGFDITTSSQYVLVKIPEIGLYVTYTHLAFYISLPFSTFYNNTEGQCGTCNNKKADDAMKRNGKIADSFTEMAKDWKVMDLVTRHCDSEQHLQQSQAQMSPSKMAACVVPSLCKLIWNLTECHNAVPPRPYYNACIMDGCTSPKQSTECGNLQAYAALCGFHGICVDWRSKTNRKCELTCSGDQIYNPCGKMERLTCSSGKNASSANLPQGDIQGKFIEGCFCPDGLIQLKHLDNICVTICGKETEGCKGPDGLVRQPGENWEKDCQVCTCSKETLEISCTPHVCAKFPPTTCTMEGFVPVVQIQSEDPCCTETVCGPKNVCVSQGTEYQPGSLVHSDSCEECICTEAQDSKTKTNAIKCSPVTCSTECQQGFRYVQEEGKCCGECEQIECVAELSSGIVTIGVGQTYKDPHDKCTQYLCTRLSDQFILSSTVKACQVLDQSNCVPVSIDTAILAFPSSANVCVLLSHECKISLKKQYIIHNQCKSVTPITIPSCEGSCDTYSV